MPLFIKNIKNKMKKAMRAKKINNSKIVTQDVEIKNNISNIVPTHNEAVANAVEEAKKHLKGYLDN